MKKDLQNTILYVGLGAAVVATIAAIVYAEDQAAAGTRRAPAPVAVPQPYGNHPKVGDILSFHPAHAHAPMTPESAAREILQHLTTQKYRVEPLPNRSDGTREVRVVDIGEDVGISREPVPGVRMFAR